MKTKSLFFKLFILLLFASNCENSMNEPENYKSYITLNIAKASQEDNSLIQLWIKNDSNKDFMQECTLNYSLYNSGTESYYICNEIISNFIDPNEPNGLLKLNKRSTIFQVKDLSVLKWSGEDFIDVVSGDYILRVQLFIKDPYSGENVILSNDIALRY